MGGESFTAVRGRGTQLPLTARERERCHGEKKPQAAKEIDEAVVVAEGAHE